MAVFRIEKTRDYTVMSNYRPSQRPSFRLRMLPSPLARFLLM